MVREAGWQPEQDDAPGGASAAIAPTGHSRTSQTAVRFNIMPAPCEDLGSEEFGTGAAVARRSG
jgi:hypothetical protein